jgi:hypothetical protein
MKKREPYTNHFAPVCEKCGKKIIETSMCKETEEKKIYWRKSMIVCNDCRIVLDKSVITEKDIEYRRQLVLQKIGA